MKKMVIAALILLVVSVGLGIWIGIAGSPYNVALLTVHKLSSIGFAVLSVIFFINEVRQTGMSGMDIVLAVVFAAALIALLATGGILSGKQQPAVFMRVIHMVSSGVLALSAGWRLLSSLLG